MTEQTHKASITEPWPWAIPDHDLIEGEQNFAFECPACGDIHDLTCVYDVERVDEDGTQLDVYEARCEYTDDLVEVTVRWTDIPEPEFETIRHDCGCVEEVERMWLPEDYDGSGQSYGFCKDCARMWDDPDGGLW